MDALVALAQETGADVAIASDPDADRVAVAVGGRLLRGDETGVLLADHLLAARRPRAGRDHGGQLLDARPGWRRPTACRSSRR